MCEIYMTSLMFFQNNNRATLRGAGGAHETSTDRRSKKLSRWKSISSMLATKGKADITIFLFGAQSSKFRSRTSNYKFKCTVAVVSFSEVSQKAAATTFQLTCWQKGRSLRANLLRTICSVACSDLPRSQRKKKRSAR